ncbi:MAG: winged helix-turn-helix domain-containing protein [Gammaproteobacteria bacterium]|nr:winged helix-turn-helix domain-containing protein [Gammaproteobacteria bacterium]
MAPRKVLIVEDEAPIRQMIAFNLTRAGFDVEEAGDCSTARARIADSRPDLVLVDWMLPDSSGLELTRALRRDEASRELPVIMLEAGSLRLDPAGHRVWVGDTEALLGPTEYRLLKFLMENQERVFSRGQLLDRVWGRNVYVEERTVDVHVRRLRQALQPLQADGYVQTVRGAGYRLSTR